MSRLHSFVNMYTSGIHAGIQTAHVVHTMMRKYDSVSAPSLEIEGHDPENYGKCTRVLHDWADNHQTIIVKNGGYSSALWELYQSIRAAAKPLGLPFARWYESKEALNGALTAVAVVLPDSVYDTWDDISYDTAVYKSKLRQITEKYGFAS